MSNNPHQLDVLHVLAGEDLSARQYHAINISGTLAGTVEASMGILQNKPENGEDAAAGMAGASRFRAGGAVTAGSRLTVTTSGWVTAADSGDQVVGFAPFAVASGGIGYGHFDFRVPGYLAS